MSLKRISKVPLSPRGRYGIIPYEEATRRGQAAAVKRLQRLQKKMGKMIERTGKTEEEFDHCEEKGE